MFTRNQEQEKVMIVLYQCLFYQRMKSEIDIQTLISDTFELPYEEVDVFPKEVVVKSLINQESIDKLISDNLINWKLERINLVAHAILMMSIGEFKYLEEKIGKAEIIDLAVKLSKKYLDDKDYKFINAILDKVL